MKKRIKNLIKKTVRPFFSALGYELKGSSAVSEFDKNTLLSTLFTNFKTMGFVPKHIIDVGANHGTWTRTTLTHFPDAHYTLLEPQGWLQSSFQDLLDHYPKLSFHAVGAGKTSGSFQFTIVDRDDSCSFRFTEAEAKAKGYQQVTVPIVTLDELVATRTSPFPDLVKIDAEGLDLAVLEGASTLFGTTEVFLVEAGVVNSLFENSILKMLQFMDSKGYRLFEITDLNRPFSPSVLWLVELAFIKKNGLLDTYPLNTSL